MTAQSPESNRPVAGDAEGGGGIPVDLARRVRLVIFDVDGVLTDAGVYMGATRSGEVLELKRFDVRDGLGMKMLRWAGLEVAMVSGRVSAATEARAAELGVVECHQDGGAKKLAIVRDMLARMELGWEEVAMVADDLPDLAVFRHVGLPVAVANAVPRIAEMAVWRTSCSGGRGAVREFCDALLEARGQMDEAVDRYLDRVTTP
jgi:3-deoxy-D-manno-octulosonate 8-phosphate phosphatase (KDO 8-P phosphatase)